MMTVQKKWWMCLALALVVVLGVGCEMKSGGTPRRSHSLQFDDLPVPRDMKINRQDSFSHCLPDAFRMVRIVYGGTMNLELLKDFYETQMPLSDWSLKRGTPEARKFSLTFVKEMEVCEISAERERGDTTLVVKIEPK